MRLKVSCCCCWKKTWDCSWTQREKEEKSLAPSLTLGTVSWKVICLNRNILLKKGLSQIPHAREILKSRISFEPKTWPNIQFLILLLLKRPPPPAASPDYPQKTWLGTRFARSLENLVALTRTALFIFPDCFRTPKSHEWWPMILGKNRKLGRGRNDYNNNDLLPKMVP